MDEEGHEAEVAVRVQHLLTGKERRLWIVKSHLRENSAVYQRHFEGRGRPQHRSCHPCLAPADARRPPFMDRELPFMDGEELFKKKQRSLSEEAPFRRTGKAIHPKAPSVSSTC